MADDEKEGRGGGEDSTFEALERDFQEVCWAVLKQIPPVVIASCIGAI